MKKLSEILALEHKDGLFGLEIEVEGANLPTVEGMYWSTVPDGSLRNGREYIFKKPVPLLAVPKLLNHLNKALTKDDVVVEFSFRTSVHVHMNMQDCTYQQVLNTIYTYLLLEAPLMNFCGEGRKGNRFCLRVEDAEYLIHVLTNLFRQGERGIRQIVQDMTRYSAINIEALNKYGSLEFRGMEGNNDVPRLVTWCTALNNIKEFAMKHEDPASIYAAYIANEAEGFAALVLQDVVGEFVYPEMVQGIRQSFSLSLDLPFTYAQAFGKKPAHRDIDVDEEEERDEDEEEEDRPARIQPRIKPLPADAPVLRDIPQVIRVQAQRINRNFIA